MLLSIRRMIGLDQAPWLKVRHHILQFLITLPRVADRVCLLEAMGDSPLGPVQYVDDIIVPCPSVGALAAVTNC
eukprot:9775910-Karenia_brevis.AAC.1